MIAQNCHCSAEYRQRPSASRWRDAFVAIASPMVRLHHLRNIRTRMLRDALCGVDGCSERGDDA